MSKSQIYQSLRNAAQNTGKVFKKEAKKRFFLLSYFRSIDSLISLKLHTSYYVTGHNVLNKTIYVTV